MTRFAVAVALVGLACSGARAVTQADIDAAAAVGAAPDMVDPEDVFETNTEWEGCWYRINADDDRRPITFAAAAAGVDKAWAEAGRPGRARKLSIAYFALGPEARNQADNYLLHYYNWLGDVARQIAAGAAVSTEMVKGYAAAFEAAGCDELIFVPTTSAPDQIGLLAGAVL
jgi:hypothetical protein